MTLIPARNVLSLLFLLQVSTTLLASSAAPIPQEGKYGLQDLEGDVQVMVASRPLAVSDLHKNLCEPERELKKRAKSTINFVLAKVNVYKDDGLVYEQNIHEMLGLEHLFVFDSASVNREEARSYYKTDFSYETSLPAAPTIIKSYSMSIAARGSFPGVEEGAFGSMCKKLEEKELGIFSARQALSRVLGQYASKIEEHKEYVHNGIVASLERDISDQLQGIQKEQVTQQLELNQFVNLFWHSEPRLLSVLFKDGKIPVFLGGLAKPLIGHTSLVILHVHSTYNICDFCRLQFTGAAYKWLYKKMVTPFRSSSSTPLFHIIVSWYEEPRRRISFLNPNSDKMINAGKMATLSDTESAFAVGTKPFVSIVKLSLPSESAGAAAAGSSK